MCRFTTVGATASTPTTYDLELTLKKSTSAKSTNSSP
jgi:hypothetical protein